MVKARMTQTGMCCCTKCETPDIEQLFKQYRKVVRGHLVGSACPRQNFLDQVGVYLWNGWGKTITGAAQNLLEDEIKWNEKVRKDGTVNYWLR